MVSKQTMWTHDCEDCIPLGPFADAKEKYDLYFCGGGGQRRDTVIARYGSDGPQYQSGMEAAKGGLLPPLTEALARAKILGLLQDEARDVQTRAAAGPV